MAPELIFSIPLVVSIFFFVVFILVKKRIDIKENPVLTKEDRKKYGNGIGGFYLLLLGFFVLLNPLLYVIYLFGDYGPLLEGQAFKELLSKDGKLYKPFWISFFIFDVIKYLIIISMSIYVAVSFFKQKKYFVHLFIIASFGRIFIYISEIPTFLIIVDQLQSMPGNDSGYGENSRLNVKEFSMFVVSIISWTIYLTLSKRVKSTFIK